jgi:hypothetical protein
MLAYVVEIARQFSLFPRELETRKGVRNAVRCPDRAKAGQPGEARLPSSPLGQNDLIKESNGRSRGGLRLSLMDKFIESYAKVSQAKVLCGD